MAQAWRLFVSVSSCVRVGLLLPRMVVYIISGNAIYQRWLLDMPYMLKTSYVQAGLGQDGGANKKFLTFLFGDKKWV